MAKTPVADKIYLVDISSFIFRAFFAIRALTAPNGQPTNAIYGVLTMLLKLLKEQSPKYLVVCYDRKEPSFRKDLHEGYKANRDEMPEDLEKQMAPIKELIQAMGIPTLEVPGLEADDLIGTLAVIADREWGIDAVIVSGDKDFSQLISDKITMFDTMKGEKRGRQEVFEKFGVWPEQFIDYLALVGDTSDNVPGVSGIGPKGASQLLKDFTTLDGIYENIDKIKSVSLKEKLTKDKKSAYLSKKLVTIVLDAPVDKTSAAYVPKEMDKTKLLHMVREWNFKSLEKSMFQAGATESPPTSTGTPDPVGIAPAVHVQEDLKSIDFNELQQKVPEGGDLWITTQDVGLIVGFEDQVAIVQGGRVEFSDLAKKRKWKFQGYDLKKIWHAIDARDPIAGWDNRIAMYVDQPGDRQEEEPPASASAKYTHFLQEKMALQKRLNDNHLLSVFTEYELPLISILYKMERKGVGLDIGALREQSRELEKDLARLTKSIHKQAGTDFNIQSPKQLSQLLFEKLQLPSGKKTKTGFSTDSDVLEKLRPMHPIINELLEYRELAKLKSTYVDSLPEMVQSDGRIHTTFNQAHTATGRLSSIDPNLQNIPIRTPRGSLVRRAFVAGPGNLFLSIDYSQIELRVLAHYCDDPGLKKAFAENLDVHTATASEVFGVSLKEVTDDMRRTAKAVNFGIAYGQGAFGLSETLSIPRSEAQEIIGKYF